MVVERSGERGEKDSRTLLSARMKIRIKKKREEEERQEGKKGNPIAISFFPSRSSFIAGESGDVAK